jgi:hypothetical protein
MTNQFQPGNSGNPRGRPATNAERVAFLKERLTPRAQHLFAGLVRKIGRGRLDIIVEMHALKVAELQAGCEALRLQMNGAQPSPELINSITRLESTAARAERSLWKTVPAKADVFVPLRERLAKEAAKRGGKHGEA